MRIQPFFMLASLLSPALGTAAETPSALPQGPGLSAKFPGDVGVDKHPSVVFVEDFERADIQSIKQSWNSIGNTANALELDSAMLPNGGSGKQSLRITGRKGQNEGGYLYKVLKPGYSQLHARMYVRFDEHYGMNHHFCKIGGDLNPQDYLPGRAGQKPDTYFLTGLEPTTGLMHTWPPKGYEPPGYWSFYSYWPEMHSWQNEDGSTNGKPNAYYGNRFAPLDPPKVVRGEWICIEWAIGLNSTPEASDGWLRYWIDGKLAGDWSPGNPDGYWMRENYRIRPDQPERMKPFPGFRWRTHPDVRLNLFKIENFVSDKSYEQATNYMEKNPGFIIDPEKSVVWFDHVVLATEYIGPMTPAPKKK